ncbi:MAG: hypothetical protein IKJ83_02345 [Ruminococcus sp.]|nr:hypothetical protein [Ruminococcus sp.]
MKKLISLILAVLFVMAIFCGCAKEEDTNTAADNNPTETTAAPAEPSLSEEAVRIYMDNMDLWKAEVDDTSWYGYLFLDLDFDGVLELIAATNMGTGFFSYNKYYRVDMDSKTVSEIPFPDVIEEMQCDYTGIDYPQLYKNNETGKLKYMMYDNSRSGAMQYTTTISELWMENGSIASHNLWTYDYLMDYDHQEGVETFTVYGEDNSSENVDKDGYYAVLEEYENNNTRQELKFLTVSGRGSDTADYDSFADLDYNAQYELLLESYNAFSYN